MQRTIEDPVPKDIEGTLPTAAILPPEKTPGYPYIHRIYCKNRGPYPELRRASVQSQTGQHSPGTAVPAQGELYRFQGKIRYSFRTGRKKHVPAPGRLQLAGSCKNSGYQNGNILFPEWNGFRPHEEMPRLSGGRRLRRWLPVFFRCSPCQTSDCSPEFQNSISGPVLPPGGAAADRTVSLERNP